jgi:tripartite-type tricarboxylate transporter receptor subunit TctC
MKLPRRQFLRLAAGAAVLPAVPRIAAAQAYPTRPVRIVVTLPAGSSVDIMARAMAQWLTERIGQPFVVDNRPGASGNLGTEVVVRSPPDGYTLLLVNLSNAINASVYDKLSFNFIRDIAPVAWLSRTPVVMEVTPSLPARTVPDFIAYAQTNPGKVNMASAGTGSLSHAAGELFKMMTGIDMLHVPYRGAPQAITDMLAGQVHVMFDVVPSSTSKPDGCVRWRWRRRHAWTCCRRLRPSRISCRAMRRVAGPASAPPRARQSTSSTGSTRRSTLAWPIRR